MKPLAPYFGNRFAAVPAKKSKRQASEMEALESRVLLSGIVADGTKSYKKLTYTDLEGDKVTISMSKGTFTVTGVTGEGNELLTLDTLNINSATSASTLKVSVKNVKPGSNGDAFTEIGSITSSASAIKTIQLNGANVTSITMASTDLDNLLLSGSAAESLDRSSPGGYSAVDQINFNAVTAKSLDRIQAATSGSGANAYNFNGAITTTAGTTAIVGQNSQLNGAVNVNAISTLKVASFNSDVTTTGDLVLNQGAINSGTFTVGGNLHLGVSTGGIAQSGNVVFDVTGSISGADTASTTDVVSVSGDVGVDTKYVVQFNAGTTFAGLTVKSGSVEDTTISAASSIGAITVTNGDAEFDSISTTSATGTIGNITISGDLTLTAWKTGTTANIINQVGNISAADINLPAALTLSNGNAINISATGSTGTIDQNITVTTGALGNISVGGALGKDIAITNGSLGTVTIGGNLTGAITVANTATATSATIGAIDIGGNLSALITSGGAVASLTVDGDVDTVAQNAMHSITGNILIGGILDENIQTATAGIGGTITVVGDLNASIIATTGNIGNVWLGSATAGVITATAGSIGNITLTDTTADVDNSLSLTTVATTGTIGTITADTAYTTSQKVTLTVTNAITVGNISVSSSAASINNDLVLSGFAAVTTLNNIAVDGDLDLDSNNVQFANVTTAGSINVSTLTLDKSVFTAATAKVGSLTVGQFVCDTAGVIIGNAVNTGSIGFITVSNASAANTVAFRFDGYTSAAGTVITNTASTTTVGSVIDAGVTAILSPSLMTSGGPQAVGSLTFAIV